MSNYKIKINGETLYIAGFKGADNFKIELTENFSSSSASLLVEAIASDSESKEIFKRYSWPLASIKLGDQVEIICTDEKVTLEPELTEDSNKIAEEPVEGLCSFCGKPHTEVKRLIRGPDDLRICNECVAVCQNILDGGHKVAEE